MKTNMFGEPILQPGDDIYAVFVEQFDTESDETLTATSVEFEDGLSWTCIINDENLNEVQAHDFGTEADLTAWLTKQGVEING